MQHFLARMHSCQVLHWHGVFPDAQQLGASGGDGGCDRADAGPVCEEGKEGGPEDEFHTSYL